MENLILSIWSTIAITLVGRIAMAYLGLEVNDNYMVGLVVGILVGWVSSSITNK